MRMLGRLVRPPPPEVDALVSRSAYGHSAKAYEAKTVRPAPSVGLWEAKPVPGGTGTSPSGEHRPDRQDKIPWESVACSGNLGFGSRLSMSVIRDAVTL